MNRIIIEPSLLSINKSKKITPQLEKIKSMGIKVIHYDVMEKSFCNNTSFITEYLGIIQKCGLQADVHLMVDEPNKWIEKYKHFKLNSLGFHVETQPAWKAIYILKKIKKMGFKTMIAVKMGTNLSEYISLMSYVDILLIMSVAPGKAGQTFSTSCFDNLLIANHFKKMFPNIIIQIDGGINDKTIPFVKKYIDYAISGSWFFNNIDKINLKSKMFEK